VMLLPDGTPAQDNAALVAAAAQLIRAHLREPGRGTCAVV
jgi:uncharacterized protein (DUF849 family)